MNQQEKEKLQELNHLKAREMELKALKDRLMQQLEQAEQCSVQIKKEFEERERIHQERFALIQRLLKNQTEQ